MLITSRQNRNPTVADRPVRAGRLARAIVLVSLALPNVEPTPTKVVARPVPARRGTPAKLLSTGTAITRPILTPAPPRVVRRPVPRVAPPRPVVVRSALQPEPIVPPRPIVLAVGQRRRLPVPAIVLKHRFLTAVTEAPRRPIVVPRPRPTTRSSPATLLRAAPSNVPRPAPVVARNWPARRAAASSRLVATRIPVPAYRSPLVVARTAVRKPARPATLLRTTCVPGTTVGFASLPRAVVAARPVPRPRLPVAPRLLRSTLDVGRTVGFARPAPPIVARRPVPRVAPARPVALWSGQRSVLVAPPRTLVVPRPPRRPMATPSATLARGLTPGPIAPQRAAQAVRRPVRIVPPPRPIVLSTKGTPQVAPRRLVVAPRPVPRARLPVAPRLLTPHKPATIAAVARPSPTLARRPVRRPPVPRALQLRTPFTSDGLPVDLPAAMMAWLRRTPAVVAAFGEDTTAAVSTKFHGDRAEGLPDPPYLVYDEVDEVLDRDSGEPGENALPATGEGHIEVAIVAATKREARQLADLVARTLKDAPLSFADGELLYLRPADQWFADEDDASPGPGVPVEFTRVIEFRYIVSRSY